VGQKLALLGEVEQVRPECSFCPHALSHESFACVAGIRQSIRRSSASYVPVRHKAVSTSARSTRLVGLCGDSLHSHGGVFWFSPGIDRRLVVMRDIQHERRLAAKQVIRVHLLCTVVGRPVRPIGPLSAAQYHLLDSRYSSSSISIVRLLSRSRGTCYGDTRRNLRDRCRLPQLCSQAAGMPLGGSAVAFGMVS
jgi:hypothetical protein